MLTAKKLREYLSYNRDTGVFVWRKRQGTANRGDVAGCVNSRGRLVISVCGVRRLAASFAWLHVTGDWPSCQVEHLNHDHLDNRWCNLSEAIRLNRKPPDADIIRQLLTYDPKTGDFHWRKNRSAVVPGDLAGTENKSGYWVLHIGSKKYQASRVAWLYMTGHWPVHQIDHINRDPLDNRWKNLREATAAQNQLNRSVNANNTSGYKGVSFNKSKGKFVARIRCDGEITNLGDFDTAEQASEVYERAAKELHGEFYYRASVA